MNPRKLKDQRWPTQTSPSASALRPTILSPKSARQRTRCKPFQLRSARSTDNWCRSELLHPRLSAPISLHPYRDALSATQSLQQSFAADSARAAAALRDGDDATYADAARAAQLGDLGRAEDPGGRHEAETRPLFRGGALLRNHAAAKAVPFAASRRRRIRRRARRAAKAGCSRRPIAGGETACR